ncbi:HGxxPAAW family protein, partial [Haloactinopolyspora alba]
MAYNSHGHTPAAWTTVIIICIAFVVGAIGVMMLNWPLFWIGGVGLLVVGGIVGKVMQMMGLGQADPQAGRARTDVQNSSVGGQD